MGIQKFDETKEGLFEITDEAGDDIGYLYYSLHPEGLHSTHIEISQGGYIIYEEL